MCASILPGKGTQHRFWDQIDWGFTSWYCGLQIMRPLAVYFASLCPSFFLYRIRTTLVPALQSYGK
jgi:hypothetical protein